MRYYLDCEFDGLGGPLISLALIEAAYGDSLYVITDHNAQDPWVIENVIPNIHKHRIDPGKYLHLVLNASMSTVGESIRVQLEDDHDVTIICDSPNDIVYFCQAILSYSDDQYHPFPWQKMQFEVHNLDSYPNDKSELIQHNAWCDAMALRQMFGQT